VLVQGRPVEFSPEIYGALQEVAKAEGCSEEDYILRAASNTIARWQGKVIDFPRN